MSRVKVGINGYGTIGKRIADAIRLQPDIELVGVVKTKPDYASIVAKMNGINIYVPENYLKKFEEKGVNPSGTIEDLLSKIDIIIDATPGGTGVTYKQLYDKYNVKAVFQGGEKPEVADLSFNTLCNYEEALGKNSLRVVSCNTTALLRTLCTLKNISKIRKVRATIVRRAADPKEIKKGPINAIVPNPSTIPSHHALDVKTVLDVDIITMAVIVPTTLMHLHTVYVELESSVTRNDIEELFADTPRILLVDPSIGLKSTAELIELARDLGRKRNDIPELLVWQDSIETRGTEVMWMHAVHQESIVVPENIDAIRAVAQLAYKAEETIELTDKTLKILHGRLAS